MKWTVYIILASDRSLYTGITTDVERRWQEHSEGPCGAKYFRGRKPEKLIYVESGHTRSSAGRREAAIKKMRAEEKWLLVSSEINEVGM